jgi:uncharacterized protein
MIGKLTDEQIEDVLKENVLGRIGCSDGEKIYVVPINYAYDGKSIIAHSSLGMKIEIMRKNPKVCFEVDDMKTFTNWKSVIAWGEYQELKSERDRYFALKLFVDRLMFMKISSTAVIPEMEAEKTHPSTVTIKPVVYRIIITEKSGRFENE